VEEDTKHPVNQAKLGTGTRAAALGNAPLTFSTWLLLSLASFLLGFPSCVSGI